MINARKTMTAEEEGHTVISTANLTSGATNDRITSLAQTAARATKEQFWDSNESSIVVAQTAVDRWEAVYVYWRNFVVSSSRSVAGVYDLSKSSARGIDKGFLIPIRDYILLPFFSAAEDTAGGVSSFLNSPQAEHIRIVVMEGSSAFLLRTPFGLGENVIVPAIKFSSDVFLTSFDCLRYPVPSQQKVRETVDFVLNGSKKNLSFLGNTIICYLQQADASLVRTFYRTRWTVLGTGPYETLDETGRLEVMNHICERYLSIVSYVDDKNDNENKMIDCIRMHVARYEFINNVRACNIHLYNDLVGTGLLQKRGGEMTKNDEWLSSRPIYRRCQNSNIFLLDDEYTEDEPFALWFRLPCKNDEHSTRDVPWITFDQRDCNVLEGKYRSILLKARSSHTVKTPNTSKQEQSSVPFYEHSWETSKYPTNAKWYNPNLVEDVLLDQKRHAVTFVHDCPKFQKWYSDTGCRKQCHDRNEERFGNTLRTLDYLLAFPPPLVGLYRPTMWRFYVPDEIRRAVWFIDTTRNGLQPYEEEAQAILEDAYHFLKWSIQDRKDQTQVNDINGNGVSEKDNIKENILLTIQVPHNGTQHLVQFSSLNMATSISKGLTGALSFFKQRVYRGAHNLPRNNVVPVSEEKTAEIWTKEDRWTTTTEEALEKLKLNFLCDTNNSLNAKNEDTNLDHARSIKTVDEQKRANLKVECRPFRSESVIDQKKNYRDRLLLHQSPLAYPLETDVEETYEKSTVEADHVVFVVHGIGEMMKSFDLFGLKKVPTIVDCCGYLRDNHAEILNARLIQISQETCIEKQNKKLGRVEYFPVEWHESFSIQSARRSLTEMKTPPKTDKVTIDDISLRTIPNFRSFANDTLMDILYFASPEHHDIIIDIVVCEMNFIMKRYRQLSEFSGKVSIIGHSIGSVITFDILDNQQLVCSPSNQRHNKEPLLSRSDDSYRYPQLNFHVDFAFMLGSPIAVFLMIRGQPLSSTFKLIGCSKFFNILHPYDPVSYRIEPLLHKRNAEIEPKIMTHWNGGYRFQYQTKRLWEKIVGQTRRAEDNVIRGLESSIEALGLFDSNFEKNLSNYTEDICLKEKGTAHKLITGSLNNGRRIDYMLQEKEIDRANEYVAAFAAHSCYWLEKDLSLFIANEFYFNEK